VIFDLTNELIIVNVFEITLNTYKQKYERN